MSASEFFCKSLVCGDLHMGGGRRPVAVTVVVTESCASVLGVERDLLHLQDIGENWCKSCISLPSPAQCSNNSLLRQLYPGRSVTSGLVYTRLVQMEPSSSSEKYQDGTN